MSNVKTTPQALDFYLESADLFINTGIMSRSEVEARHEIMLEEYMKKIQIESRVLGDIAGNHVVPTAIRYQNTLIENVQRLKDIMGQDKFESVAKEQLEMITEISERISAIIGARREMIETRKRVNVIENARDLAIAYCEEVKPFLDKIRYESDKLEMLIDDEIWPLPKYRELLFTR